MSKSNKVRILEAFQIKEKRQGDESELGFKVQTNKGQESVIMLYDQVKYTYPIALIDFFEAQTDLFHNNEENIQEELTDEQGLIFDYDNYVMNNSSKILEHINSFTLSFRKTGRNGTKQEDFEFERVFQREAANFYENFVQKSEPLKEGHMNIRNEQIKKGKKQGRQSQGKLN